MRNCKMCGVSKKDSSIGESERMQSKHRSCFTSMREIASEEMAVDGVYSLTSDIEDPPECSINLNSLAALAE